MLIVEGPDLVGKTTLCKELVKQLDGCGLPHDYAHLSRRTDAWQVYEESTIPLYLARASRFIVQDRFHMSDPIYHRARAEAGSSAGGRIERIDYELLDSYLRGRYGAMTVVLIDDSPDAEIIRSRWRDGEMYDLSTVIAVNNMYRQLAASVSQTWQGYRMLYDWIVPLQLQQSAADIARRIVSEYKHRQTRLDAAIRSTPLAQGL